MMFDLPVPAAAFRRRPRGFTLMELMIAMAVSAILIGLAMPSYSSYMRKSRRVEAKSALLDLASRQEKFFSMNNAYTDKPANLGLSGAAFPVPVKASSTSYYSMTLTLAAGGAGYTATVVPSGDQASDACGSFTLTHLGVQGNTGNTQPSDRCW